MAVLYLTNSESFNIDISLNIALVWASLSALQISLMAFFWRVNKHFTFDGYVLPQISLQYFKYGWNNEQYRVYILDVLNNLDALYMIEIH